MLEKRKWDWCGRFCYFKLCIYLMNTEVCVSLCKLNWRLLYLCFSPYRRWWMTSKTQWRWCTNVHMFFSLKVSIRFAYRVSWYRLEMLKLTAVSVWFRELNATNVPRLLASVEEAVSGSLIGDKSPVVWLGSRANLLPWPIRRSASTLCSQPK